ncbi:MAG: hypothetical protein KAS66_09070 [Candidatus Omnitrophica bacterium]|nr:hypothetical protein [Candidatus Omnitrophota bacterium]
MIDILIKKIIRFLRFDRKIQLKLCGFAVLVVMIIIQANILNGKEKELEKVSKEKNMVMRVPELEKEIQLEDLRNLTPEKQIAAIKRILEGTSYRNRVYHAVIDGEVYSTGSVIGDYTITRITMAAITLENKQRKEIQKLYFPEDYTDGSKK